RLIKLHAARVKQTDEQCEAKVAALLGESLFGQAERLVEIATPCVIDRLLRQVGEGGHERGPVTTPSKFVQQHRSTFGPLFDEWPSAFDGPARLERRAGGQ